MVNWETYTYKADFTAEEIINAAAHYIFIVERNVILGNVGNVEEAKQLWVIDSSQYFIDMVHELIEQDRLPKLERVVLWGRT